MFRIKTAAAAVVLAALSLPVALWGQPQKSPKPLTETDVLKLIELQMDDGCIVARIQQGGGPGFQLDAATEKRLRGAGASDEVIAALKSQPENAADLPDDPARQTIAVWVKQAYNVDCPLVSEMRVNGNLVQEFSSTAEKSCGKHFKMGWNTITLKTRVRDGLKEENSLHFEIGPTRKDPETGKTVMDPVLWSFTNQTDWVKKDAVIRHLSGPDVKEVTLTFRVYFAGVKHESAKVKEGDYVFTHAQGYASTPPVTSTVFVNGTPLTTFLGRDRNQRIITPLLKKGKNEIRVQADVIPGVIEGNTVSFHIAGPAEWNAVQGKFQVKQLANCRSTEGWVQEKSGKWRVDQKPGATTLERTLTFQLDEDPNRKG